MIPTPIMITPEGWEEFKRANDTLKTLKELRQLKDIMNGRDNPVVQHFDEDDKKWRDRYQKRVEKLSKENRDLRADNAQHLQRLKQELASQEGNLRALEHFVSDLVRDINSLTAYIEGYEDERPVRENQ